MAKRGSPPISSGSSPFSGDRAPARRKGLEAGAIGIYSHRHGYRDEAGAQRKLPSPGTLPIGEMRGFGGKAPIQRNAPHKKPALDIHANYSSPETGKGFDRVSARSKRHQLRRVSGRVLGKDARISKCGQKAIGSLVTLHRQEGHAHFGSVETCGSVWTCPVCAPKITEGRKEEIGQVMEAHKAAGGKAYMATLTLPHNRFQTCKELLSAVSKTWSKVKSGASWRRNRDRLGWIGDVRALEVTHGANGWHPHIHLLVFFRDTTSSEQAITFGEWLFDSWAAGVRKLGYGHCERAAFTFDEANTGAGDYVGKWGAPLELTKAHLKTGKLGRTPWQILADIAVTNQGKDRALFREYASAFKGRRQLVWSQKYSNILGGTEPSIRQRYAMDKEASDEDLAEDEATVQTHAASLDRELFQALVAEGLTAQALSVFETGGVTALGSLLTARAIPWRQAQCPGLDQKPVPVLLYGHTVAYDSVYSVYRENPPFSPVPEPPREPQEGSESPPGPAPFSP